MNKWNIVGLRGLWDDIQSSLWFRPGLISLFAVTLALISPYIDQLTSLKFYVIDADNARTILSVIASSMLTIVTMTFSILMVALTLTSQQFSSRVLRSFTSDRAAQNVLGILIGSFLYSLLVLVTVINTSKTTFVPLLSVLMAIGFALVGIGTFIFFIDHIAKSIRVSYIIQTINDETIKLLDGREVEEVVGHAQMNLPLTDPVMNQAEAFRINASTAGYIQTIDIEKLAELTAEYGYIAQIDGMAGSFVSKGRPLLYVWNQPTQSDIAETEIAHAKATPTKEIGKSGDVQPTLSKDLIEKMQQQFDIGVERTMYEDILFGIRQLVDIAIKALSPGVNDPTTARNCIHYLTNILIQAIRCPDKKISYYSEQGNLCLIGRTLSFEAMVNLAFDQVRHYGCSDPLIAEMLLIALFEIAEETGEQEHLTLLWHHTKLIRNQSDLGIQMQYDRNRLNNRLLQMAGLLEQDYESVALNITDENKLV